MRHSIQHRMTRRKAFGTVIGGRRDWPNGTSKNLPKMWKCSSSTRCHVISARPI